MALNSDSSIIQSITLVEDGILDSSIANNRDDNNKEDKDDLFSFITDNKMKNIMEELEAVQHKEDLKDNNNNNTNYSPDIIDYIKKRDIQIPKPDSIKKIIKKELKISTITATAYIPLVIDLITVYDNLDLEIYNGLNNKDIIEIGSPPPIDIHPTKKPIHLKTKKNYQVNKKKRKNSIFYNSMGIRLKQDTIHKELNEEQMIIKMMKKNFMLENCIFIKSINKFAKIVSFHRKSPDKISHLGVVLDKNSLSYYEALLAYKKDKCIIYEEQAKKLIVNFKLDEFYLVTRKIINFKLFNNGKIQLTGLKTENQGKFIIDFMLNRIKDIYKKTKIRKDEIKKKTYEFLKINQDSSYLQSKTDIIANINYFNFEIVLINSDFAVNFKIKRDNLYNLLLDRYKIICSYEPCTYPGVNTKYYWNKKVFDTNFPGCCICDNKCSGKGGKGLKDGDCKKVTISVFQSGNIIITGARTQEQINICFKFITKTLYDNYYYVKRKENNLKTTNELLKEKIILIDKSKIINYDKYNEFLKLN